MNKRPKMTQCEVKEFLQSHEYAQVNEKEKPNRGGVACLCANGLVKVYFEEGEGNGSDDIIISMGELMACFEVICEDDESDVEDDYETMAPEDFLKKHLKY